MKKTINVLLLSFLLSGAGSCIKDTGCQDKTVASETATMTAYAQSNSINATTHSSGLMYEIVNAGTGAAPSPYSTVSVKYTGKLLDGTVFDSQTTNAVTFSLSSAIYGWQLGLPLIKKGGTIRLIIPSSLAYGCSGKSPIPSNAILYFDVQLVDVI